MYSITKMCNSKKDVEAVYLFLSDLCSEYSNFRQWYHDTVVPGLANGERLIYAVTDNEAIVAVLILKNADEKKICTLRVAENHRHQGIASMLLTLAFRELQCTKPLITVSSYHIDEFKPLLRKAGLFFMRNIQTSTSGELRSTLSTAVYPKVLTLKVETKSLTPRHSGVLLKPRIR